MAILPSVSRRVDVPHEKGQWFEFAELSTDDTMVARREAWKRMATDYIIDEDMREEQVNFETAMVLLEMGITAWSYDQECANANKRRLDAETQTWALGVIRGTETDEDVGKGSEPSPAT